MRKKCSTDIYLRILVTEVPLMISWAAAAAQDSKTVDVRTKPAQLHTDTQLCLCPSVWVCTVCEQRHAAADAATDYSESELR